jgi:galactokinase
MEARRPILRVTTPGRICLFGEHQDYLLLPVLSCAISLRIGMEVVLRSDPWVRIALPDVGAREDFSLDDPLEYRRERDYFRSAVTVLRRSGFTFSRGCDCTVHGEIPINSGTSSSSALVVTWVNVLARISDQGRALSALEIARLSHEAEVVEFGEPGGMMDHLSTAHGGVLAIDFTPELRLEAIPARLGAFVLGDSQEPKDTRAILSRVKAGVLHLLEQLREQVGDHFLETQAGTGAWSMKLSGVERRLLEGTFRNRDLTSEARALLRSTHLDHRRLGKLLDEHHAVLRDDLGISTPKIDRMLAAARRAGAYGGKINGSGGGGCMFAYAPEDPQKVAQALERAGGIAYLIRVDEGTRLENREGAWSPT